MIKINKCFIVVLFFGVLNAIPACRSMYDVGIYTSDKVIRIILKNPDIQDLSVAVSSASFNIIDLDMTKEQVDSINYKYNNTNVNIFIALFNNNNELPFLEIFTDDPIFLVSEQELPYLKYCKKFSQNKGKDYIQKCIEVLENNNGIYVST